MDSLLAFAIHLLSCLGLLYAVVVVCLMGLFHGAVDAGLIDPKDLPSDEEHNKQVEEEMKKWKKKWEDDDDA